MISRAGQRPARLFYVVLSLRFYGECHGIGSAIDAKHPVFTVTAIYLSIFDVGILVECASPAVTELVRTGFSAFEVGPCDPILRYRLEGRDTNGFQVQRDSEPAVALATRYECLYHFEKDLTIQLELVRKDLFFIHGAVVTLDDRACLISAPSGSGKSTISWALLHHGFGYMSDELAPIELSSLRVQPYPHAVCHKRHPPAPYSLPQQTLVTECTLHVPVEALPSEVVGRALPLSAMLFVRYNPKADSPSITPISTAEGCMHLFANGLNQLQHENKGLAAAADIAKRVPAYKVETAELGQSALLLREFTESLFRADA